MSKTRTHAPTLAVPHKKKNLLRLHGANPCICCRKCNSSSSVRFQGHGDSTWAIGNKNGWHFPATIIDTLTRLLSTQILPFELYRRRGLPKKKKKKEKVKSGEKRRKQNVGRPFRDAFRHSSTYACLKRGSTESEVILKGHG